MAIALNEPNAGAWKRLQDRWPKPHRYVLTDRLALVAPEEIMLTEDVRDVVGMNDEHEVTGFVAEIQHNDHRRVESAGFVGMAAKEPMNGVHGHNVSQFPGNKPPPTTENSKKNIVPGTGSQSSTEEHFLGWIRRNGTILAIAATLCGVIVTVGILLWATMSARFDDAAIRATGIQADARATKDQLNKRIGNVSTSIQATEDQFGKRIDDVSTDIRATEDRLGKRIDELRCGDPRSTSRA